MKSRSFEIAINRDAADGVLTEANGVTLKIERKPGDCPRCPRLRVLGDNFQLELLPTKGLTIGEAMIDGLSFFWNPPIDLVDPDELDLWSDVVRINGEPAAGFEFLKTFAGSVELYGLRNWGMPTQDGERLMPLHGETSNIPVQTVRVDISENQIDISADFTYRDFKGDADQPWYLRGEALFQVERTVRILAAEKRLLVFDEFQNIGTQPMAPDWGYHITLRPEPGSKLIIPSRKQMNRSGEPLPEDIQTWQPAADDKIRTEAGIIHRQLEPSENELGKQVRCRLDYPNGRSVEIGVPPSPYLQSWFCNGGAGSTEFTDASGLPLFQRNWDGQGIEIGASALDHDGNTDPDVPPPVALAPNESSRVVLDFLIH